MNDMLHLPTGFYFKPTDEQLIQHYLKNKIASRRRDVEFIDIVDLNEFEPWDLSDICYKNIKTKYKEWYFFSYKDIRFSSETRVRTTKEGYWIEGIDMEIYSESDHYNNNLIGMKRSLFFFNGKAPNGEISDWALHEYRIDEYGTTPQEKSWVLYKMFKRSTLHESDEEEEEEEEEEESLSRGSFSSCSSHSLIQEQHIQEQQYCENQNMQLLCGSNDLPEGNGGEESKGWPVLDKFCS